MKKENILNEIKLEITELEVINFSVRVYLQKTKSISGSWH